MEKRIYLATKASTTVGVNYDITNNRAMFIQPMQHATTQTGFPATRESALYALVEQLKTLDVTDIDRPVYIYVIKSLHDMIMNGTYKYWILSGKKSNGEDISESEMKLWIEFHTLYTELGLYVHIKDIFGCKLSSGNKFKPSRNALAGDKYAKVLWKKLADMGIGSNNIADVEE